MRNKTFSLPITSIEVSLDDIRRLAQRLDDFIKEHGNERLEELEQQPEQSDEDFSELRKNVLDQGFRLRVMIDGANGETLDSFGPETFDRPDLPDEITYIRISNREPYEELIREPSPDHFTLCIDFRKPPLIDFNNLVSAATPNDSSLTVFSLKESFSGAIRMIVSELVKNRKTGWKFLHENSSTTFCSGSLAYRLLFTRASSLVHSYRTLSATQT